MANRCDVVYIQFFELLEVQIRNRPSERDNILNDVESQPPMEKGDDALKACFLALGMDDVHHLQQYIVPV